MSVADLTLKGSSRLVDHYGVHQRWRNSVSQSVFGTTVSRDNGTRLN